MSEQIRESLSALMDGELEESELELLLHDSEGAVLRDTWVRYHAARRVLRDGVELSSLDIDISAGVRAAVAEIESATVNVAADAAPKIKSVARQHRFPGEALLRPAASFAVAASVFASVLIGSQWYGLLGSDPGTAVNESQLAARHSTIGMVNTLGGSAVNATYGPPAAKSDTTRQARAAYNRLARQRLQRYLLPHTEEAALNAPQGMMPYARVAAFRTQD